VDSYFGDQETADSSLDNNEKREEASAEAGLPSAVERLELTDQANGGILSIRKLIDPHCKIIGSCVERLRAWECGNDHYHPQ
jgi:hypothetical protein